VPTALPIESQNPMRRRSGGLLCCGYRPGMIYQCTRRNRPVYPRLAGYVTGIILQNLKRSSAGLSSAQFALHQWPGCRSRRIYRMHLPARSVCRSWRKTGALREVGRCLRLLGELSGELRSGPAVNVTLHLEKSVSVLLRATPDEFVSFWKSIVSQASPEQLSAALSAEEVQRALAASSPFFDSLLDRQAIGLAAAATLSEEDRSVLDKLRSFREEHQTVKCGDYRVVLDDVAMAL
jgi:hypothetical protein